MLFFAKGLHPKAENGDIRFGRLSGEFIGDRANTKLYTNYMNRKLRVLVVSYLPWNNDISVGNTLSNIFQGMEDKLELASMLFLG